MDSRLNNDFNYFIGFIQIINFMMYLKDVDNDTILHELQKQNKEYLQKIIKQNEKIIDLLNK